MKLDNKLIQFPLQTKQIFFKIKKIKKIPLSSIHMRSPEKKEDWKCFSEFCGGDNEDTDSQTDKQKNKRGQTLNPVLCCTGVGRCVSMMFNHMSKLS